MKLSVAPFAALFSVGAVLMTGTAHADLGTLEKAVNNVKVQAPEQLDDEYVSFTQGTSIVKGQAGDKTNKGSMTRYGVDLVNLPRTRIDDREIVLRAGVSKLCSSAHAGVELVVNWK